jgi:molybdopterin converting factor small subunit
MPPGSTLADLSERLMKEHPSLEPWLRISRWAVNESFVSEDYPLENGMRVASIPPVSGG